MPFFTFDGSNPKSAPSRPCPEEEYDNNLWSRVVKVATAVNVLSRPFSKTKSLQAFFFLNNVNV